MTQVEYVGQKQGVLGPFNINELQGIRKALGIVLDEVSDDNEVELTEAQGNLLDQLDQFIKKSIDEENSVGSIS